MRMKAAQPTWLVDGRYNESDGAYLDVSNLDGSDRRRVAEGDDLPDLTNAYVWYTDGTALYTFVRSYGEFTVLRLDEGGAACIFTRSIPDGEDYFAVGCWQDKIVLQHSGGYQQQPLNHVAKRPIHRAQPVYCGSQRHDAACEIRRDLLHNKWHRHGRRTLQLYHLPRRVRDHFG